MVRWNTRFRKGNHSGHSRASHLHAWPFPWLVHNIRQIWTTVNIFHTITTTSFILTSLDALVPENPTVYHTRREATFPAMISHPNNKQQGINFETLAMQTGHLKTSQSVQLQGKLGHAGLKLHRGQACSQTSLLNVCSQIWHYATWPLHHGRNQIWKSSVCFPIGGAQRCWWNVVGPIQM